MLKKKELAPIIVFCYNRKDHLKKTIEALASNPEAANSNLFVFSDGPREYIPSSKVDDDLIRKKNNDNKRAVNGVREYINSLQDRSLFASVTIYESEVNKGLATSVITGVDKIIRRYGKAIIVEDDAVCSSQFLKFMNEALEYYEDISSKIWFIGGYCPPLNIPEDYPYNFYKMGRGSSYAWATWLNRWEKIDWSIKDYSRFKFNFFDRRKFNLYGDDRAEMLDRQMLHLVDSWAVRFAYNMYRNKMFAILPTRSLIKTIGRDGSGTHAMSESHDFDTELSNEPMIFKFENIDIDPRLINQHVSYFRRSKTYLFKQFIKNNILKSK